MERRLKELRNRHFLIRSGDERWAEVVAAEVPHNSISIENLVARSNAIWARERRQIEAEITARRGTNAATRKDTLDEWN